MQNIGTFKAGLGVAMIDQFWQNNCFYYIFCHFRVTLSIVQCQSYYYIIYLPTYLVNKLLYQINILCWFVFVIRICNPFL